MSHGLKSLAWYVLGLDRAERNFAVYPDDTFLVSYPRSGSTWSRFLIANLVHQHETVTFTDLDRLVPATSAVSHRALKRIPRPRIIKCHNYFDHRYGKVIYIVRDPRDVVLSEYRFLLKRRAIPEGYPMPQFVASFTKGRVNNYSSWHENVASWLVTRGTTGGFLLLRYEDMVADTPRELTKIAEFLGIDVSGERIAKAVERSSADKMRALEKTQGDLWIVTKGHRKDVPFVGDAEPGRWRTKLPETCVSEIEKIWGPLMAYLGYDLMFSPSRKSESPLLTQALVRV